MSLSVRNIESTEMVHLLLTAIILLLATTRKEKLHMVGLSIGGFHKTSRKCDHANYDQFLPNFSMTCIIICLGTKFEVIWTNENRVMGQRSFRNFLLRYIKIFKYFQIR